MRLIKSIIEKKKKKKMSAEDNPCWKGYEMIDTKMKDGKEVPNCVPISKENIKPYLSKNLLSGIKMKEFNDSIYVLHINYQDQNKQDSYKYQSDKVFYSESKTLVDVLNDLNNFLNTNNITFKNIDDINEYKLRVITDTPSVNVILEKEHYKWAVFEKGQIFAEFE
jgi:hypothetical protein